MSLFDDHSQYNKFIVTNGYGINSGDGASAYIVYKQLERKVIAYILKIEKEYTDENFYTDLDLIGRAKMQNLVSRTLEKVKFLVLKRLDAVTEIEILKGYCDWDIEDVVDKMNMGSVREKIEKLIE